MKVECGKLYFLSIDRINPYVFSVFRIKFFTDKLKTHNIGINGGHQA